MGVMVTAAHRTGGGDSMGRRTSDMAAEDVLVIDDSPTILKVVQLALTKAGYRVQTAPDGDSGLELARESRPDLILLDFVMPKMNGYQVCRALADDKNLADVPVLLMSAKGEEVGEKFVKVTSVVDYITKPFSPEAILAVVAHTIDKRSRGSNGSGAMDPTPEILLPPPPPETPFPPQLDSGMVVGRADLSGNLGVISVADVLTLLQDQSQTGVLENRQADARVDVFFRGGRIDFASAAGVADEFLLGRYTIEAGQIGREAFAAILDERARAPSPPGLLGADLVRRGLLTPAALKQAMARQTSELVYEILRWGSGVFAFRATTSLPSAAEEARLGIAVDNLLMDGFRRVDEWRLIEREIESFELVFVRNEDKLAELGRGRLTREELTVLELVNGKNSVRDIIRSSRMGSFDVTKMLYRLLRIKLVRRRVAPMAV